MNHFLFPFRRNRRQDSGCSWVPQPSLAELYEQIQNVQNAFYSLNMGENVEEIAEESVEESVEEIAEESAEESAAVIAEGSAEGSAEESVEEIAKEHVEENAGYSDLVWGVLEEDEETTCPAIENSAVLYKEPSFCQTEHSTVPKIIIKRSNSGGISLTNGGGSEVPYTIVATNMDSCGLRDFHVKLDFSCNIMAAQSPPHLNFQILKQDRYQLIPVPVSANYVFAKEAGSFEANMFSITACDNDSQISKCCSYSVTVKATGVGESQGTAMITNAVLMLTIVEKEV